MAKSPSETFRLKAYHQGAVDVARVVCSLAKSGATAELIADVASQIARDVPPIDEARLHEIVVNACRFYRFFDVLAEPDWLEPEDVDGDGVPVLPAYRTKAWDGTPLALVWCGECFKWHTHGQSDGHRTAHCTSPKSAYYRSGYILRVVGDMPPEQARLWPKLEQFALA